MTNFQHIPQKTDLELIDDLLNTLNLTKISERLFRGESFDYVGARIFGGQLLAQALSAAARTLSNEVPCHSLHAYFLFAGDVNYPVFYEVTPLRDGKTLSARQIHAYQEYDGKTTTIFTMLASFAPFEGGLDHHTTMPDYPSANQLLDEQALKEQYFGQVPAQWQARFARRRHWTVKPIHPQNPLQPTPTQPKQAIWGKLAQLGNQPQAVQQALLAFVSDYYLATTGLLPHGINMITRGLQIASLDHALYFHRPVDLNDWLLYEMKCDTTANAKGLNFGQFWQDGKLVATSQQETLMRLHDLAH